MPELPDITIYRERLAAIVVADPGPLLRVRLVSPFLLRSVEPPLSAVFGKRVVAVRNIAKRLVLALEDDLFIVIHLMIAGRLRWKKPAAGVPGRVGLAAFDFDHGTLLVTEASKKRRAALHVVRGLAALEAFQRGGVDPLTCEAGAFSAALMRENHTLKRALTDQRVISGIGNAYSDEILHRARLSPFKQTSSMAAEETSRLHAATVEVLAEWIARLRTQVGDGFPDRVTAFRAEMAVHGKYRQPCPACGDPVQRIRYADNEANYCATCQTGGKVLADRSLSRLLKQNWPRTLEELEERRPSAKRR